MHPEHRLGLSCALVLAACGSPAPCAGTIVTVDGETYCVLVADAGTPDAGATECAVALEGVGDRVRTAVDRRHMRVGASSPLGNTTWSQGGAHLFDRDGWLWWLEANDRCGMDGDYVWWGLNTVRFRDDGLGGAVDVTHTCEPETFPLLNPSAAISPQGALLECGQGHHPSHIIVCGTLGSEPGSFQEVESLEPPRSALVGNRAEGFIVLHRHSETGEIGLRLLNELGVFEREVMVGDGRSLAPSWVGQMGDEAWIASAGERAGAPARMVRVPIDGLLRPVDSLPPPIVLDGFPEDSRITLHPTGAADAEGVTLLLREETPTATRLHLARVRADGSWGSRLVSVGAGQARLASWEGGFLILLDRAGTEAGADPAVELLRVDCGGQLLEPPLPIASGDGLQLRAMTTTDRAWAVLSRRSEPASFDHEAISVELPPP